MWSSMKAVTRFCKSLVLAEYSKSMVSPLKVWEGLGPLCELPVHLGHRSRTAARGHGLLARCGTGLDPLGNALQDRGHAEQVVGLVEVPVGRERLWRGDPGAVAVLADVFALGR